MDKIIQYYYILYNIIYNIIFRQASEFIYNRDVQLLQSTTRILFRRFMHRRTDDRWSW